MRNRRLRMEALEDRRMLATFTVSNLLDGPVTAAGQLPGSLRQAIFDANATSAADEIVFQGVNGTLVLTAGQLHISRYDLTITAPGPDLLTINANQQSRIFQIDHPTTSLSGPTVTLTGMALTGGRTTANVDRGGAIRALVEASLTLNNCTISGNSTTGEDADGGAISTLYGVTLNDCIVSDNHTTGRLSSGGGISAGSVRLTNSVVSENSTAGESASGGGISTRNGGLLNSSLIHGNSTAGANSNGGGISSGPFDLKITNCTISGNFTSGTNAHGGGINAASASSRVTILNSTITNNSVLDETSSGGGIWISNLVTLRNSIVAENVAGGSSPDIYLPSTTITANYTILGTAGLSATHLTAINSGTGNLLNIDPQLGPLADNGGLTLTHALLTSSPATSAGDPAFDPADPDGQPGRAEPVVQYDQRGIGFNRIVNSRIDIGAYEAQELPIAGDFDSDGDVDGRDFLLWQRNQSVGNLSDWQQQYGEGEPSAVSSQLSAEDDEVLPFIAAPANQSVRGYVEGSDYELQYVDEVDRAIEQFVPTSSFVRSFGEMVARRSVKSVRFAAIK